MDPFEERFICLGQELYDHYATLTTRLGSLPLPISLPRLEETPESHLAALDSLEAAADLLHEMPLAKKQRSRLHAAIVDWSTLYELIATIQECGPSNLRLTSAKVCSARIGHFIENYDRQEAKN